jgi:hypothetical protein
VAYAHDASTTPHFACFTGTKVQILTPAELGQLELRLEAMLPDFTSQNVAVAMWALATLGRMPVARLMALIERRIEAISGEFDTIVLISLQGQKYKY